MLKKSDKLKLKALGFDVDKLEAAITAEAEVDFAVPEITTYSDEQLAERDKNTITAARGEIYKEGKNAGIEIANKAIVKKYNLADVDVKDVDKVIAALDGSVAKGDTGLKEQIALLQSDKQKLEASHASALQQVEQVAQDRELVTYFPKNRLDLLTDDDYLSTVKRELKITVVDGVKQVERNGQVLRDPKTQAPIPVKNAIEQLFTERKFVGENGGGGRGGDDNPGGGGNGGIKKFSQLEAQYLKDNPGGNVLSPDFMALAQKTAAADATFDWNT